ncbi:aminoglycoside phosphotransferase [Roseomonas nepalensis]|uniref:Hydroxylysine kinase n=1 Tax=Muricoccus nepalensis TaxID=1854500 RepID=A0A502FJA2_9PROT|nr:phosphotransferase [Roseomonas nepalensis]TPG49548.1 aminoglycoside phosphotransferase [Roseomonas nepalensis]
MTDRAVPPAPHGNPLLDPLILAPPPTVDAGALARSLEARWGLRGVLVSLGGERDRNYRLDRGEGAPLLVKVAHPDEDPAITDFQTAALLHLEAAGPGLPLPRVVRARDGATSVPFAAGDGRPCRLRVLTFLPGRVMDAPLASARALGDLAARLDRALEGFAHPADRRRLLWDIREAPALRDLLGEVSAPSLRGLAAAALDRFEAEAAGALAGLPGTVIHNDLNPHNVLVAEGDPAVLAGIIDFGDLVRASRLQEVATACAYLLGPGEDPLAGPAAFLAGYRPVLPLPDEEARLLPALMATRMAMTVLITHWRAARQPENAAYVLRNMPRAREGLARLARLPEGAAAALMGGGR